MRFTFAFLFLCSLVLPASMNAQIGWSKKTYNATGFHIQRGDFNNDGYPDLFIYDGNTVSVLLNNGSGSFGNAHTLDLSMTDATLVDFNRDGNLDVAGCNDGILQILDGNGDGSLTIEHPVQEHCAWVAAGDFNGDGNPDLVVGYPASAENGPNTVLVLLGTGDGGFLNVVQHDNVNFNSSEGNACVLNGKAVAADFTGDKIPDLFITADCPNDVVSFSSVIVGVNDGTGHLTFHKDVETSFDSGMVLRLTEGNNDKKNDVIAVGQGSAPHGAGQSALFLFLSHGDGTFETKTVAAGSQGTGDEIILRSGAFADFNGDGIKDGLVMVDDFPLDGGENLSMQLFAGQPDGSYKLAGQSSLGSQVSDMVWGDFDKDAVADVALVRPSSTDVWLNRGTAVACSPKPNALRSLSLCPVTLGSGTFLISSTPLDNRPINSMQLYVDGVLTVQTPDDLLDNRLSLTPGQHRITAKGWDDLGAFSATTIIPATTCTNTTNETVKICKPFNGTSFTSTGGKATVEIQATAATNLKFSALQVYIDGSLSTSTSSKTIDVSPALSTGTHRITVKGWDSSESFSTTVNVTVK
jgi:hypothetical protein